MPVLTVIGACHIILGDKLLDNTTERVLMDELDRKIIGLLQMDGRASNAKIAREVGVSEGTVRRRLRRLIQEDVVKVIAVPNL